MNWILGDLKGKYLLEFMDDTRLGTANEDERLESPAAVLDFLYEAAIRLKLSKCSSRVRQAEILGHVVDKNGVRWSDKHVAAIRVLEMLKSEGKLMRLLGLINLFVDILSHFAGTAATLYQVLKGTRFPKKRRQGQRLIIADWKRR